MAGCNIDLYVGFFIQGDAVNIEIYDSGAASAAQYTIPEGTYFFNHSVSAYNVVYQINQLLPTGYSVAYENDRQLQWSITGSGRYFRLPSSDDQTVLAEILGLYDNSGSTAYFQGSYCNDDWIGQVTLGAIYLESVGRIYPTHDLYGYANFGETRYKAGSGAVSRLATARVQELPITWQHCDGDVVKGDFAAGTQTTLGSSTAGSWSASFDRVFNPLLREPVFEMQDGTDNLTYYMDFEFNPDIKVMTVARWNGLFDVTFPACIYTEDFST